MLSESDLNFHLDLAGPASQVSGALTTGSGYRSVMAQNIFCFASFSLPPSPSLSLSLSLSLCLSLKYCFCLPVVAVGGNWLGINTLWFIWEQIGWWNWKIHPVLNWSRNKSFLMMESGTVFVPKSVAVRAVLCVTVWRLTKWLRNYSELKTINVTLHISRIFHMNDWIAVQVV